MLDEPINAFEGVCAFLGDYWPCNVALEGTIYPSLEHACQAAKVTDAGLRDATVSLNT